MTPTSRADLTPAQRLRSIFSGSVGNLVEWYDWYVYAAFSLYFAEVFFPGGDRTSQLLKTAAIFAVGFLMRPLGGWLLGRYADRHGRRRALMLSVVMMCGGSLIIACTPGYASIGVAAPILLVLARLDPQADLPGAMPVVLHDLAAACIAELAQSAADKNIALALGIKAVFLVLALFGSATMWMAVFADMGASLLVVANGLRMLRVRG